MEENNISYWDKQLDSFGIDAVIWQQGDDYGRAFTRDLTILFKELIKDEQKGEHRLTIGVQLLANKEQTIYRSAPDGLPKTLRDRGVEEAWVEVTNQPYHRSRIHLRLRGIKEPVVILNAISCFSTSVIIGRIKH